LCCVFFYLPIFVIFSFILSFSFKDGDYIGFFPNKLPSGFWETLNDSEVTSPGGVTLNFTNDPNNKKERDVLDDSNENKNQSSCKVDYSSIETKEAGSSYNGSSEEDNPKGYITPKYRYCDLPKKNRHCDSRKTKKATPPLPLLDRKEVSVATSKKKNTKPIVAPSIVAPSFSWGNRNKVRAGLKKGLASRAVASSGPKNKRQTSPSLPYKIKEEANKPPASRKNPSKRTVITIDSDSDSSSTSSCSTSSSESSMEKKEESLLSPSNEASRGTSHDEKMSPPTEKSLFRLSSADEDNGHDSDTNGAGAHIVGADVHEFLHGEGESDGAGTTQVEAEGADDDGDASGSTGKHAEDEDDASGSNEDNVDENEDDLSGSTGGNDPTGGSGDEDVESGFPKNDCSPVKIYPEVVFVKHDVQNTEDWYSSKSLLCLPKKTKPSIIPGIKRPVFDNKNTADFLEQSNHEDQEEEEEPANEESNHDQDQNQNRINGMFRSGKFCMFSSFCAALLFTSYPCHKIGMYAFLRYLSSTK